jgi:predicted aminopeptidase
VIRTVFILFSFLLTSCANTLYLGKLAWGEAKILAGSVPNQQILLDEGVEDEIKEGIHLVEEVKGFCQQQLGLQLDNSFKTFYQVKRGVLVYLVSACPQGSLVPYAWRFPIVGEVEYKGFFSRNDAIKEIKKLEAREMDTCLQQAIAFSTLGWLSDPLYSTILDRDPAVVITIVIHELVHNTIFFKGATEFNERVASFIAEKGSLMFIEERFGCTSPFYQHALDLASDERLVAGFLQELYDMLKDLYDQDLPHGEKMRMREEIFVCGLKRWAELGKQLKAEGGLDYTGRLNNAVVVAYRRYLPLSDDQLQQAYEALGCNMKRLIELLRAIRKSKEQPCRYLERWLQERPTSPSR